MYDKNHPKPVAFHALTGALSCYGIITTKAYLEKAIKKGMPVLKERTSATGRSIRTMSPEDCAEWIKEHWEMFPFNHFSLELREQFAASKDMSEEDMLGKYKGSRETYVRKSKSAMLQVIHPMPDRSSVPSAEVEEEKVEWYSDVDAEEYDAESPYIQASHTEEQPVMVPANSPWSPLNALSNPPIHAYEEDDTVVKVNEWKTLPRQLNVAQASEVDEDYRVKVGDEVEICKWNGRLLMVPERYLGCRGTVICAENDMGQLQVKLHNSTDAMKSIHVSVVNVKLVQYAGKAVQYKLRETDNGDILIVLRNGESSYALCKFRAIPELSISSEDIRIMAEGVVSDFL